MKYLISAAAVLILFSGCALFNKSNSSGSGEKYKLNILAFNIHHGAPQRSEEINLENIAASIRAGNADIVALQEMDKETERSHGIDQTKVLAEKLGMEYFFSKSIDYMGGEYGVAVLSKYPIVSSKQIILPNTDAKGEQRSVAYVTIKLPDGSKLDFASTHLDLIKANREDQTKLIATLPGKTKNPLIIAGDFNAQPRHDEIKTLYPVYDVPCDGECPLTSPALNPVRTIDYIFSSRKASEKFKSIEYRALSEELTSDHLPVLGVYEY